MLSFKNDPKVKEFYVNRMNEHAKLDQIIQGTTWKENSKKGCFIGCTFHDYNHKKFETEGIGPEWLARLAERIFEGSSVKYSKSFAKCFYKAIPVGVDLEQVKVPFIIYILKQNIKILKKLKNISEDLRKQCIDYNKKMIKKQLYGNEDKIRYAVESAAKSAESAAWFAAGSTIGSAEFVAKSAESAARYAVESAARSADSTARSVARSVARSAARSADSTARSAAWFVAGSAARSAAYEKYGNYLLKLLRGCK